MAFSPKPWINLNDAYSEHLSQQQYFSCSLHICDISLSSYIAAELVGKRPALLQPTIRGYFPREKKIAYPQEGEVSVVLNAGDFQVAHNYLAVLIVLAQGPILLLQVREGAQLVLGAGTHCKKPQDTQSE